MSPRAPVLGVPTSQKLVVLSESQMLAWVPFLWRLGAVNKIELLALILGGTIIAC